MSRIIAGRLAGLTVADVSDDPLLITMAGALVATDANPGLLVAGIAAAWTIDDEGLVTSPGPYGIALLSAGTISIGLATPSAAVSGAIAGIVTAVPASTIVNDGSINGTGLGAIWLQDGGTIDNGSDSATSARLSGLTSGVYADGAPATIDNRGTIAAGGGFGVIVLAGGSINNGSAAAPQALITGAVDGIADFVGSGTLTNAGTVQGISAFGALYAAGGTIANAGLLSGAWSGAYVTGGAASIANTGTIAGSGLAGLWVDAAGSVVNGTDAAPGASIAGQSIGLFVTTGTVALDNRGTISAAAAFGAVLVLGGTVNNGSPANAAATIAGPVDGLAVFAGAATLTNYGTISGSQAFGLIFAAGGSIANAGQIGGGSVGAELFGPATLSNTGTILGGGGFGAVLADGGTLGNAGLIRGGAGGLQLGGTGSRVTNTGLIVGTVGLQDDGTSDVVANAGTIASSDGAAGTALRFGGAADTLRLLAGASFVGQVAGAGDGTLELAAPAGTLSGLGTAFTGFATLASDAGTRWTVAGSDMVQGGGSLLLGGTLTLAGGAILDLEGAVGGGGGIDLGGAGTQVLVLGPGATGGRAGSLGATIRGVGAGDAIVLGGLAGTTGATVRVAAGGGGSVVTVLDQSGGVIATLSAVSFAADGLGFTPSVANGAVTLLAGVVPVAPNAPTLAAMLSNDTGTSAGDGITTDPAATVHVSAPAGLAALTAMVDGGAASANLLAMVGASGDLSLTTAQVDALAAGGTLAPGSHLLRLLATDAIGQTGTFALAFTIDGGAGFTLVPYGPYATGTGTLSLSGVARDPNAAIAGVTASLDGAAPVAVPAIGGGFTIDTASLFGAASAVGPHDLTLFAATSGGAAGSIDVPFIVGSGSPNLTVATPGDGGTLTQGAVLSGRATPGLGALVSLGYAFDGGAAHPVGFDPPTGAFTTPLDLSTLAPGSHTLLITARDSSGGVATVTETETLAAPIPLTVTSVTPASGATQVGVTYRPTVTFSRAVDPATITSGSIYATDSSGAVIPASVMPMAGGLGAELFFKSALPGSSTITLHVVGSLIKGAADGAALGAGSSGVPGSALSSTLQTVSETPVANTVLTGIVADPGADLLPGTADDVVNNTDGTKTYRLPIAGVTVSVIGDPAATTTTDANGRFTLRNVPIGDVKIEIQGLTATNDPTGYYFPDMTMDTTIKPGVTQTLMGSMGPAAQATANAALQGVYLPRVQTNVLMPLDASTPTVVKAPITAAGTLTANQISQLSLTVSPGSLVDAQGNRVAAPMVGISPVPSSIVQDMLPPGLLQHSFDITIQAPGGAVFTTPATLTMPNVFGLAPGEKTEFLSFNHTTGRLEIDGTATVSADGQTVTTDPGQGITQAGWHGMTPPGSPADTPPPPCPPVPAVPDPTAPPPVSIDDVNAMLTGDTPAPADIDAYTIAPPAQGYTKSVSVTVDGPLSAVLDSGGDIPVSGGAWTLTSGDAALNFGWTGKSYGAIGGLENLDNIQIYGGVVTVSETTSKDMSDNAQGTSDQTDNGDCPAPPMPMIPPTTVVHHYYIYRYIDPITGATNYETAVPFDDAIGSDSIQTQTVDLHVGGGAAFTASATAGSPFTVVGQSPASLDLEFDPTADATYDNILQITPTALAGGGGGASASADGAGSVPIVPVIPVGPGTGDTASVNLVAEARQKLSIYFNETGLIAEIKAIYTGALVNLTPLSADLMTQISTDEGRQSLADKIIAAAKTFYDPVAGFVDIETGDGATDAAGVKTNYAVLYPDPTMPGVYGEAALINSATKIANVLASRNVNSLADTNYLLTQAINDTNGGSFTAYIGAELNSFPITADFVQDTATTLAHEAGHVAGLVHLINIDNTDLMSYGLYGTASAGLSFKTSLAALKIGLGEEATPALLANALHYYALSKNASEFRVAPGVTTPDTPGLPQLAQDLEFTDATTGDPLMRDLAIGSIDRSAGFSEKLAVTNYGSQPATISSARFTGSAGFQVDLTGVGGVIQPGATESFTIAVSGALGPLAGTISIQSSASTQPYVVALSATGTATTPALVVRNVAGNFGGLVTGTAASRTVATLANYGMQPLLVTGIAVKDSAGADFTIAGLPADLGATPIAIAPGGTYDLAASLAATTTRGLENGRVVLTTNDPLHPTVTLQLGATSVGARTVGVWGGDFVDISFPTLANATSIRQISDSRGNFTAFLPPSTPYQIAVFDPVTGLIAHGQGTTSASGNVTDLTATLTFKPSTAAIDAGGLPDDIEQVLNGDPAVTDNFVPGLSDFNALQQGLITNATLASATGLLASAPLQGSANNVALVASISGDGKRYAYVATGSYGLAVVDVTQPFSPSVIDQLKLTGSSTDVAIDTSVMVAAVASGSGGVTLVDVSTPATPAILATVPVLATAVVVDQGVGYVNDGAAIDAIDLLSGQVLQHLSLGAASIRSLTRDGSTLFAIDTSNRLTALTIGATGLAGAGRLSLSVGSNGRLYAAGGVVYVPGDQGFPGGYATVNAADPATLTLIAGPQATNIGGDVIALNGSGIGVIGGHPGGVQGSNVLDVVTTSDPAKTGQLVTRYALPATPLGVAIGSGVAFVADGTAGLQIVNYKAIDTSGVGPTITVLSEPGGNAAGTAAISLLESSTATFTISVSDPGQLRGVELLENGASIVDDVTYPYDLTTTLPSIAASAGTLTLQVRATDTAGNVATSPAVRVTLLRDLAPPLLVSESVVSGEILSQASGVFRFVFSKPLDAATVTSAAFGLSDAAGLAIAPVSLGVEAGGRVVVANFGTLPIGALTFTLDETLLKGVNGVAVGAAKQVSSLKVESFSEQFSNPAGGDWNTPSNWSTGALPKPTDTVFLGLVLGAPVTFARGTSVVSSLASGSFNTLALTGGTITVTGTTELTGTTEVDGGTLAANGAATFASLSIAGGTVATSAMATDFGALNLSGARLNAAQPFAVDGTLSVAGASSVLTGETDLFATGTISNATLQLGGAAGAPAVQSAGTLAVETGATLALSSATILNGNTLSDVLANAGTVVQGAAGTSAINGVFVVNTGGTILASGSGALLNFTSATITGGTLTTRAGGAIVGAGGVTALVDVAISAGSTFAIANTAGSLTGAIANAGTIGVSAYFPTSLETAGTATLSGGGMVALSDSPNNFVVSNGTAASLTNFDNTIAGAGSIGDGFLTLVNRSDGIIDATLGNVLIISTGGNTLTNAGLLESTDGSGGLTILGTTVANTGTIAATGTGTHVNLQSATIVGGVLATAAGDMINATDRGSVLDGVTLAAAGVLAVASQSVTIRNTLDNLGTVQLNAYFYTELAASGTATLAGGGAVAMNGSPNNQIATDGTHAASLINRDNLITGAGQIGDALLTFTNQAGGTVDATAGNALVLNTGTNVLTNAGLLESTSGVGGLSITGTTVANTGTIAAVGAGAVVNLRSAVIDGGLLADSAGGLIYAADRGSVLDGVTLAAGSQFVLASNSVSIADTLDNLGTVQLNAYFPTDLAAVGTATLAGGGTVLMSNSPNNQIFSNGAPATFVNVDNTISGAGQIGDATLALTNLGHGVIDATLPIALVLSQITVTNTGLLESTGTADGLGGLHIDRSTIDNRGSSNAGVILSSGATSHVDLSSSTILGGTLETAQGGVINVIDRGVVLSAATLAAKAVLQLASTSATLRDVVSLGTIMENAYFVTQVAVGGTLTLQGGGAFLLNDSTNNQIISVGTAATLLDVDQTIAGAGVIGDGFLAVVNGAAGTIDGTGGQALVIATGTTTLSNAGLLESTSIGGLSIQASTVANTGTIAAAGARAHVDLQTATIQGGVLSSTGGGLFRATDRGSVLSGVTITAGTRVSIPSASLTLAGTIANAGSITLDTYFETDLIASGTVTLQGGGSVVMGDSANSHIVGSGMAATLINAETISGAGVIGDGFLAVVNGAAGTIDGTGFNALVIATGTTTLSNAGLIESTTSGGLSIQGSTVANTGTIAAVGAGVHVDLQTGTIQGGVLSSTGGGLFRATDRGSVLSGVTITAGTRVSIPSASLTLAGTIANAGSITLDTYFETDLIASGTVTLQGGGIVVMGDSANSHIVGSGMAATLINAETISGAGSIGDATLTLVNAASGLIEATSANALSIGAGGFLANAGTLRSTSGGMTVRGTVGNTGTLWANGAGLVVTGAVQGTGVAEITAGATLELGAAVAAGQTITFDAGSTGALRLDQSQSFAGSVAGLAQAGTNRLDLSDIAFIGTAATRATFVGTASGGTLTVTDGTHSAGILLQGNYVGRAFQTASDGHNGTLVTDPDAGGSGAAFAALLPDASRAAAADLTGAASFASLPGAGSGGGMDTGPGSAAASHVDLAWMIAVPSH